MKTTLLSMKTCAVNCQFKTCFNGYILHQDADAEQINYGIIYICCESIADGHLTYTDNPKLHGPSMFAVKAKIYMCSIIQLALSILMKHLIIGQHQKAPNFSAFHWSPHGRMVSIGQHFVTTRVVHLPKRTETSLIT